MRPSAWNVRSTVSRRGTSGDFSGWRPSTSGARRLLHGDVKPGNIFLDGFLKPYLVAESTAHIVVEHSSPSVPPCDEWKEPPHMKDAVEANEQEIGFGIGVRSTNKRVVTSGWRRWRIKHWKVWGEDLGEGCHE